MRTEEVDGYVSIQSKPEERQLTTKFFRERGIMDMSKLTFREKKNVTARVGIANWTKVKIRDRHALGPEISGTPS